LKNNTIAILLTVFYAANSGEVEGRPPSISQHLAAFCSALVDNMQAKWQLVMCPCEGYPFSVSFFLL